MSIRHQRKRRLRTVTIVVAIFASFSQLMLVDAVARTASHQTF